MVLNSTHLFPNNIGQGPGIWCCNLCRSGQERPFYQIKKTKHTQMYSMCPVKSNQLCFVWTMVPFQFLFLSVASWSCIISLSVDFSVLQCFPAIYIIPSLLLCRENVGACLSLHNSSIPHPSFPPSFPIQFLFRCLTYSRRQVEISWKTSFSADKYLAWLRKTHISLSNQLFPLLFFLSYPIMLQW